MLPFGSRMEINGLIEAGKLPSDINIDRFYEIMSKRADAIDVTAKEFEDEEVHKPNAMYDVDGELHETDDDGNVYMIDGRLLPNTEYTLNGHTYTTDEYGRIIRCNGKPVLNPENIRNNEAQTSVGGEDRRPGDQGGHIIAREMNGDGGLGNLVPMDARINMSDYKNMETDIKKAVADGKDVSVNVEISYDGDSERPSKIRVEVTADGEKTVYSFDNDLDGSLNDLVPENGKEMVDEALKATNGEISSVKQSYDANGNLTETTVTITYTDETGQNQRESLRIPA